MLLTIGVIVLCLGFLTFLVAWLKDVSIMSAGLSGPLAFGGLSKAHGRMMQVMGLGSFGALVGLGLIVATLLAKAGLL